MEAGWVKVGLLRGNPVVGAVAAHEAGYGLIGTSLRAAEGSLFERMSKAKATLVRATESGAVPVWEGGGHVVCVDGAGDIWFAVVGTLKQGGEPGSDYTLLRSIDGAKSFETRARIALPSIAHVVAVSEDEAWVLGAGTFARTIDGGAYWIPVELPGERDAIQERLRRSRGGVALLSRNGFRETTSGGSSWGPAQLTNARICGLTDTHVLGTWDDIAGVAKRDDTQPFAALPPQREPLAFSAGDGWVRVLSRHVDGARGPEMTVHRYDVNERSWTDYPLSLSPNTSIAGPTFGVGTDIIGGVHVAS